MKLLKCIIFSLILMINNTIHWEKQDCLDALRPQLIRDEGYIEQIYLCKMKLLTFGVGHLIKKEDPEFGSKVGTPISKERILTELLSENLADEIFNEITRRVNDF